MQSQYKLRNLQYFQANRCGTSLLAISAALLALVFYFEGQNGYVGIAQACVSFTVSAIACLFVSAMTVWPGIASVKPTTP